MASVSLWIYRLLLGGLLPIALPIIKIRQRLTGKSRPRFRDRLARSLPELPTQGVWIQAVSVGEVELARGLVAELETRAPDLPLFLTATTATGLDLARRTLGERMPIVPCPIDLPGPVSRVFDAARPELLVLVETELWPEMLHQAGKRDVPVAVVNARLSPGSFAGYRRVAGRLRTLLAPLALVLARTSSDAERFAGLNVPGERIVVSGNIKYDLQADQRPLEWEQDLRRVVGDRAVMVAGSTMEGEETQILDALSDLGSNGTSPFLILAPRHPERFDAVARLLIDRGLVHARRSSGGAIDPQADVFLIDVIGELARAYRLAQVAFIGGSLVPTGGHNPLEPAVWGVPVLSGPHVFNFAEVYEEMVEAGGARLVADGDELRVATAAWLDEPDFAAAAGSAGREVVERNRGATSRTVSALLALIPRN
jgi:3-deoxy-D-manno-octulosonic-acid transferase